MRATCAVLLAGCGPYDGTDPFESVLLSTALIRRGHEVVYLTLDTPQEGVTHHGTGMLQEDAPARNLLEESARLVRGKIFLVDEFGPAMLDALFIPGGQGVVKNLLHNFYSVTEPRTLVEPVRALMEGAHAKGKPIAALSLAEFLLSAAFGPLPKGALEMGPTDVLADPERRLLLGPGSIRAHSQTELADGIEKLVDATMDMVEGARPRNPFRILPT